MSCKGFVFIFVVGTALMLVWNPLLVEGRDYEEPGSFTNGSKTEPIRASVENDAAAVVQFNDRDINPQEALRYYKQCRWFVEKLGGKHTTIFLSVLMARIKSPTLALSSIFLRSVAEENGIRERDGKQPIQVFLHFPIKSLPDRNSLQTLKIFATGLVNHTKSDGVVSGLIFEPSLILNPVPATSGNNGKEMNKAMVSSVVEFKMIIKSLHVWFGHEIKMGLALSSYQQCITCLVSKAGKIMTSFDIVVWGTSLMDYRREKAHANEKQDTLFHNCVAFFQIKYPKLVIYHVEEYFDFKN